MDRINIRVLDDLIAIYFGQDYDLFDDTEVIEPKIDAFFTASHKACNKRSSITWTCSWGSVTTWRQILEHITVTRSCLKTGEQRRLNFWI